MAFALSFMIIRDPVATKRRHHEPGRLKRRAVVAARGETCHRDGTKRKLGNKFTISPRRVSQSVTAHIFVVRHHCEDLRWLSPSSTCVMARGQITKSKGMSDGIAKIAYLEQDKGVIERETTPLDNSGIFLLVSNSTNRPRCQS